MRWLLPSLLLFQVLALGACSSSANDNAHTTATTTIAPSPTQVLTVGPRPVWMDKLMSNQEASEAKPTVTILSPKPNESFHSATVNIRLSLRGALKAYQLNNSTAARTTVGVMFSEDHVHFVLDNLPPEDYYDLSKPLELHKLTAGKHTLRVFAVRPWHESYKNVGSFQTVVFNVIAEVEAGEIERVAESGTPDPTKPLLTYSSPKGEYHGAAEPARLMVAQNLPEAKFSAPDPIMIDFWLVNAKLKGDGGEYRIRYFIDDDDPRYIDKWEPVWLKGWTPGKHSLRLELLGADQYPVQNGGYNITTCEITVVG